MQRLADPRLDLGNERELGTATRYPRDTRNFTRIVSQAQHILSRIRNNLPQITRSLDDARVYRGVQ